MDPALFSVNGPFEHRRRWIEAFGHRDRAAQKPEQGGRGRCKDRYDLAIPGDFQSFDTAGLDLIEKIRATGLERCHVYRLVGMVVHERRAT